MAALCGDSRGPRPRCFGRGMSIRAGFCRRRRIEFVPPGPRAHFERDTGREALDLSAIRDTHTEERGDPPDHPGTMVALLLDGDRRGPYAFRTATAGSPSKRSALISVGSRARSRAMPALPTGRTSPRHGRTPEARWPPEPRPPEKAGRRAGFRTNPASQKRPAVPAARVRPGSGRMGHDLQRPQPPYIGEGDLLSLADRHPGSRPQS